MEHPISKKNWFLRHKVLTFIILFFGAPIFIGIASNSLDSSRQKAEQVKQGTSLERPAWYAQEVTVNTADLQGTSMNQVNLWPSYDDRSKVVGKLENGDAVNLVDFDKANNYCQVQQGAVRGWADCQWFDGLPDLKNHM